MTGDGLADGLLIELAFPDTGVAHRVAQDGRYLVGDEQRPPTSEAEPGAQVLSGEALERLRAALEADDFFALPAAVPPSEIAPGLVLPSGRGAPRLRPVELAARDRAGRVRRIRGAGDPRATWTFGRLAHVVETLDREALGGWLKE